MGLDKTGECCYDLFWGRSPRCATATGGDGCCGVPATSHISIHPFLLGHIAFLYLRCFEEDQVQGQVQGQEQGQELDPCQYFSHKRVENGYI